MASHFMIDLKTMSTAADAAILSIGIQEFDPRGEGIDESAGALIHVDLQACMNAGLRVDADTVMWWLTQSDDARAALVAREPLLLSEALVELVEFGQSHGGWAGTNVWSNGAAFGIPILEMAFRRCRRDIPWEYNKVLDVRTMKWLAPDVPKVVPRVAHDALSDAQTQALYVQNCYRAIKGAPTGPDFAPTHIHVKRGSSYQLLGEAEGQISSTPDKMVHLEEGAQLSVYRNERGKMYWRLPEEFRDGRFEVMGAAAREEDKPQPPAAATETIAEAGGEDKTAKLGELWDHLGGLDWWYMMSEDPGVYRRGEAAMSEAQRAADALGQEGMDLFRAMEEYARRAGPHVQRPGA